MTYCVAWKSEKAVLLAADAAVTSGDRPRSERSSFGEKHAELTGMKAGRFVQEQTLKLHDLGCCGLTFAGVQEAGYGIIDRMERAISEGATPIQAFTEATAGDLNTTKVRMAMAFLRDGVPTLAAYNLDDEGGIDCDVQRVQFGSMKEAYYELTSKYIDVFAGIPDSPSRLLVQGLAVLQSYGIHDYLMESGVGGGFCGMYIDQDGLHWQPDILYLVAHPRLKTAAMVGSFARRNVWCLFSSMSEYGGLVYAHMESNESGEMFRQRVTDVACELEARHDGCRFDYVTVLNTGKHVASVIELLGRTDHKLISLEPNPERDRTINVYWSPRLQELFDTVIEPDGYDGVPHDMCVQFYPHRPPDEDLSPEFRAELREKANRDTATEDKHQ